MCGSGFSAGWLMALRHRYSYQIRYVPSGFRANTTDACRRVLNPPAVEEVDELRAQFRQSPLRQPLHRTRPRHRRVARLDDELHAAVRRQPRGRAAEHVGVLSLKRREGWVVRTLETESASARQNDARCSSVPSLRTSVPRRTGPRGAAPPGSARRGHGARGPPPAPPPQAQRAPRGQPVPGAVSPSTAGGRCPVPAAPQAVPGGRWQTWRRVRRGRSGRNIPCPITVERVAGGGRAAGGRRAN
jgi:hypothetical protein